MRQAGKKLLILGLLLPGNICTAQGVPPRPFNALHLSSFRIQYAATGARPLAMGGATIAISDEPTAISVNPAGLAQFVFPAASLGHRFRHTTYTDRGSTCSGPVDVRTTDFVNDQTLVNVIVPAKILKLAVFREVVLDEQYTLFTPGSVAAPGPGTGAMDFLRRQVPARNTQFALDAVDNAVAAGAAIGRWLNVGASFRLTGLELRLIEDEYVAHDLLRAEAGACVPQAPTPENWYLQRRIEAKKWAAGFNAGILFKPHKALSAGLMFTHRPAFHLDLVSLQPAFALAQPDPAVTAPIPAAHDTSAFAFNLPDVLGIGLSYRVHKRLHLAADLQRIFYTETEQDLRASGTALLDLIQDNNPVTGADPDGEPDFTLADQWQFRTGVEFEITPRTHRLAVIPYEIQSLHLRAGYFSQPAGRFQPRVPDAGLRNSFPRVRSSHFFTVGLGAVVKVQNSRVRIDTALSYGRNRVEVLVSGAVFIL